MAFGKQVAHDSIHVERHEIHVERLQIGVEDQVEVVGFGVQPERLGNHTQVRNDISMPPLRFIAPATPP